MTGCPWATVDERTDIAILAAGQAEHGCWPHGGGWLNETLVLIEAVNAVWADQAREALARMRSRS